MNTLSKRSEPTIPCVFACLAGLMMLGPPAFAAPYEIPAVWKPRSESTWPATVTVPFRAIEHVPGLGIVAYTDALMLRIADGQPFVTLGVRDDDKGIDNSAYVGAAAVGDDGRLLVRTRVEHIGDSLVRRTELAPLRGSRRGIDSFRLPPPRSSSSWSVVRLFSDRDGDVFAYAGSGQPSPFSLRSDHVHTAIEQRFFLTSGSSPWAPLAALAPEAVSATDACIVNDTLLVVGDHETRDMDGNVTNRSVRSAILRDASWEPVPFAAGASKPLEFADGLACRHDSAYLLGGIRAQGQEPGAVWPTGPQTLSRFDGRSWVPLTLPTPVETRHFGRVSAVAVSRDGSLWIAARADSSPPVNLYRYRDGSWSPAPAPRLAFASLLSITGLAFADDGTGWAIANLDGDATVPESRGLLLQFDGASWSLRGISWNPLRQRAFGLLGPLR